MRVGMTWVALLCAALGLCACGASDEEPPAAATADTGTTAATTPDAGGEDACARPSQATPPDACPSDEFSEEGICLPLQPVLVPPEGCPNGLVEEGTCRPLPPTTMAWSCPGGWRQVTPMAFLDEEQPVAEDVADLFAQQQVCAPPETPDACPPGTMALLGEPDCVAVGSECPSDAPWPDEATLRQRAGDAFATGQLIYVSADADADGDGSREAPAQTIAGALALAADGDIVAIGVGQYDEEVALTQPVALLGACAGDTTLATTTADDEAGTLTVTGAGVLVRDLTVTGPRPGVVVESSGDAVLEGVQVYEAARSGVWLRGGRAVLRRGAIRETRSSATMELGHGLNVTDGATLEADHLHIQGNRHVAVRIDGEGTTAQLTDTVIADTQPQESDNNAGLGIAVQSSATLEGARLVVANNHAHGLHLTLGGVARLTDVHIQGTLAQASDGTLGHGIRVRAESSVEAERVVLTSNTRSGALITGAGSDMRLTDGVIAATQPGASDAKFGRGVGVEDESRFEGERLLITHSHTTGIYVSTEARLTDVVVTHTQPAANNLGAGQGVLVTHGGAMSGERFLLLHNHQSGLQASRDGFASVTDVTVRDTRRRLSDNLHGRGLDIKVGGRLEGRRILLVDNNNLGLYMSAAYPDEEDFGKYGPTEATLAEVTILQTRGTIPPEEGWYGYGWGVGLYNEAQLLAERFVLARNEEGGFGVTGEGTRAVITDLLIRDTQPLPFDNSRGAGLGSFTMGAIEGARIRLENHYGASLLGFREANSTLTDLTILNTRPQQSDLDFGRGVSIESGSALTATRVLIEDSHDASIVSTQRGTRVELTDLIIRNTAPRSFDMNSGVGVSVSRTASATLNRFSIDGSALVGLQVVGNSTLEARAGQIADNFIGLNIQSEGFDLDQSLTCVNITDNCCGDDCASQVCNIESTDMVVPKTFDVLTEVEGASK